MFETSVMLASCTNRILLAIMICKVKALKRYNIRLLKFQNSEISSVKFNFPLCSYDKRTSKYVESCVRDRIVMTSPDAAEIFFCICFEMPS